MDDKFIVTAAITGSIHTPTMSPYLPITPQEIVDEAVRACEAGAAVAHIHVRHPESGKFTYDMDLYREVITGIKRRCDMVICITTGGFSPDPKERALPVSKYKPELASFNAGSMNFGLFHLVSKYKEWKHPWELEYLSGTEDLVFANSFKAMREFSQIFMENETKPECEVYDVGMINNLKYLLDCGFIKSPLSVQFVLGILGGIPATFDNLLHMVRTARDTFGEFEWSVAAAGRFEMPMCTAALLLGGNVRVGLEDALSLKRGVKAKSNAELVEKIVRIGRELGREPATPNEARGILRLKGLSAVSY